VLRTLTILIVCQFIGEVIARAGDLPLPGPVIGLVLLLGWLVFRGGPDEEMRTSSSGLLRHLLLLFVPAGAGIVTQLDVLGQNFFPAIVAIVVSTALGLGVTGWVMQRLSRKIAP
jgi:holin-like protein